MFSVCKRWFRHFTWTSRRSYYLQTRYHVTGLIVMTLIMNDFLVYIHLPGLMGVFYGNINECRGQGEGEGRGEGCRNADRVYTGRLFFWLQDGYIRRDEAARRMHFTSLVAPRLILYTNIRRAEWIYRIQCPSGNSNVTPGIKFVAPSLARPVAYFCKTPLCISFVINSPHSDDKHDRRSTL